MRTHDSSRPRDATRRDATRPPGGFSLVELLLTMSVLTAIAIPVLLSQRVKGHDAGAKADVTNLGREAATYWVGGNGPLVLDHSTPGLVALTNGSATTYARLTVGSQAPAAGASAALDQSQGWCVALNDPAGRLMTFKYTALDGLNAGACP